MQKRLMLVLLATLGVPATAAGMSEDDPTLFKLMFDKLEWRDADEGDLWAWDADAWLGKDLHKLWLKTEGERAGDVTQSAYGEVFYSRAVAPYWDLQVGWRRDFDPDPDRDWFAVGLKGLAPYFFETDATLYAGGNGAVAGRIDVEYEILFTQKLILAPEFELNFYSKDDPERGIGSGLSTLDLGLRLRYEIRRQIGPYIGVNWEQKLGRTADLAEEDNETTSELQFVAGVRAWF